MEGLTEDLLTTAEVARMFRVDPSTVRRWRLDGVGPRHVSIGSVHRYPRAAIDEWLAHRMGEAS
jgi:predicted DNA-binding transcriptional regulator AlpA